MRPRGPGNEDACRQDVFTLLVPSLLTTCYTVVELNRHVTFFPTTCYRPAIQQFVNRVTPLLQLDKITALLQLVDKLATGLFRTHLCEIFTYVRLAWDIVQA